MDRLAALLLLLFLLCSCAFNYTEKNNRESKIDVKNEVAEKNCKPQREVLVDGKCVKRRGFM